MVSDKNERKLIDSAIEEFSKKGYAAASLRDICEKAGLSTGYIYSHYTDKAGLFRAIVGDVAEKLDKWIDRLFDKYTDDSSALSPVLKEREIIGNMYDYKPELLLLFAHSQGTEFEDYPKKMLDKYEKEFVRFYRACLGVDEDPLFLSIICRMRCQSYFEILSRDLTREQSLEVAGKIGLFKAAGLRGLEEIYRNTGKEHVSPEE
jgi:AcrR family transcriptional regulator